MVKVLTIKQVGEVTHADWLQKAGIHDFREWNMDVHDTLEVVYAKIGPGGNSGAPVTHNNEEAAFVIKGELVYVIGGKEITVKEGSTIFVPAHEMHFVRNDTKETVLRLSLEAHPEWKSKPKKTKTKTKKK